MNEVDRIRLEQFRQLRKEIRGSEGHLIVGIDVGKDKHHAFLGTATGEALLKRLVFENNLAGVEKLLDQVEAVKVGAGLREVVFGMEPTANYHKPLGGFFYPAIGSCGLGFRGSGEGKSEDLGWAVGQE